MGERALLEAVVREVVELERLCAALEDGIVALDFSRCEALLADMRRVTHGLVNAMQASEGHRDATFESQLQARVQRIITLRDEQIQRLQGFHDGVGERLRTLSNWKVYARSVGAKEPPKRSAGLDSTS